MGVSQGEAMSDDAGFEELSTITIRISCTSTEGVSTLRIERQPVAEDLVILLEEYSHIPGPMLVDSSEVCSSP